MDTLNTSDTEDSAVTSTWNLRSFPLDLKRQAQALGALEGISDGQLVAEAIRLYLETKKQQ